MAAAEADEIIPSNPVRKTRLPRRGSAKERADIAPEKIRELLTALPEPSRSLAQLLVFTGLRIGELLALRWRDVDLERCGLRVTQSVYEGHFDEPKSKRSKRSVPLGAKSIEILTARKPAGVNPDALVFGTDKGTPFDRRNLANRQLKPTCKKIGLTGVGWHWLRHANATLLDAVGTPVAVQQKMMRHADIRTTFNIYGDVVTDEMTTASSKVAQLAFRMNGAQTERKES